MKIAERENRYIAKHLPQAKAGDTSAMHNVGAAYRILGKNAAAYRWWKKSAASGDGADSLEVGYCLHHGVGVRKNTAAAADAYEIAMVSDQASQFDREEAMYLRASLLLLSGTKGDRRRAVSLLVKANTDNDYPQASNVLSALDTSPDQICTCRRELRRGLARLHCRVHQLSRQSRTSRSSTTRVKRRAS